MRLPWLLPLLFLGCAEPREPLYFYGDYSNRYYAYKKNPGPETAAALRTSIETAIAQKERSRSGRVPPGMYASLGYLHLEANNGAQAAECFTLEKALYPESSRLMERLLQKIAAQGAPHE